MFQLDADTRSKPFQFGASRSRLHVYIVMMQFNSIDLKFYSLYRLRLQSATFVLCLTSISAEIFQYLIDEKSSIIVQDANLGGAASRRVVIYHDFSNWKHKWLVSRCDDCDDEAMTGGVSGSCRRTSVISDRSRANVTTGIAKFHQLWRPVTDGALAKTLCCLTAPILTIEEISQLVTIGRLTSRSY